MALAFLILAFVFKFSVMQKKPHLKKLRSVVIMKQAVGFFQLSLVLVYGILQRLK